MSTRLYRHFATMAYVMAAMGSNNGMYDYPAENPMNNYQPAKVGGFTKCKGRKHLSKKKRKELNKR